MSSASPSPSATNHCIVGAHREDNGNSFRGAAYVFSRDQGGADNWGEVKKLGSGDGTPFFGYRVGVSSDTAVVGTRAGGTPPAYVYSKDEGGVDNWGEVTKLFSNAGINDQYGTAVGISGDAAIVGAERQTGGAGAAHLFALRKDNGELCTTGPECATNNCIDGVCCDTLCAGGIDDCQACSIAAGGTVDGTCGARVDGLTCDDGLYCNGDSDTCGGGTCSVHANAPCLGPDGDNDCVESCDEATDTCTANDPNGSACDDGVFCNGTETCTSGVCGSSNGDPCLVNVGDADADCSESCDETADDCVADDPDASACDDGSFCNGTETCTAGACGSSTGDPCTINVGDADSDCSESCDEGADDCVANDPDASACDDGAFCNGTETCTAGVCGSSTGDPCTVNVGDADADCSESCNEGLDDCVANDPDGSACDDGTFCNGAETCTAGVCGSSAGDPCVANVGDADNDCTESCDEAADMCSAADPDGSACDDGAFCNGTETCTAGVCGTSTGDPCTEVGDNDNNCFEACNEPTDTCTAQEPDGTTCLDDGLYCTGIETCQAGVCAGGGDPCTEAGDGDDNCAESCNETADDCTANDPNGDACDDGLYCNGTETCQTGSCGSSTGDPCETLGGRCRCRLLGGMRRSHR